MSEERAKKVLVVDDDRITRRILTKELTKGGYEVVEAVNGSDALKHILSHDDVDLMTLDVNMPKMNGYMTCSMLRSWEIAGRLGDGDSALPVIFVTGADSISGRHAGFEAGSIEFISKGFRAGELLAVVDRILKPRPTPSPLTALIADHNPLVRRIFAQLLIELGLECIQVGSGREALAALESGAPKIHMLVTDLKLPKMDAVELIYQIRNDLQRSDLLIIGICPKENEAAILELFKAGADDYVLKPGLREILCARFKPHLKNLSIQSALP